MIHKVDPRLLTEQFDLDLLGNSTKLTRRILSSSPLTNFYGAEAVPGLSAVPANATDEQWKSFIVGSYNAVLKGTGSVSMLPKEDGGAVDSSLVVYGTENVRVVGESSITHRAKKMLMSIQMPRCSLSRSVLLI